MDALGQPPLTGRARELAQLGGCFARLEAGRGTLLFVVGDAGMGKSRLAAEAVGLAAVRGVAAGWGRGRPDGATPTLLPWAEALAGVGVGDLYALAEASGGDRGEVFNAVVERLRLASPVALVLDDLDDADDATLALLGHVAGALPQLAAVVLATLRSGSASRRVALGRLLRQLADEPSCDFLELDPLAVDEAIECAQAMSQRRLEPERVIAIVARSGGNPFLIGELLRATAEGVETSLPRTAQEVLADRLAGLDPRARRAVEALAVLGGAADDPTLAHVAGTPLDALEIDLGPVVAARLAQSSAGPPHPEGEPADRSVGSLRRVTHPLVREAVMADLDDGMRRQLHRRALEALAAAPLDPGVRAEVLAHHAIAGLGPTDVDADIDADIDAEVVSHAALLVLDAARWCVRRAGPENAARLLDRALATPVFRARRSELSLARGEALLAAGSTSEARAAFGDALGEADGDAELVTRARAGILACVAATPLVRRA